MNLFFVILCLGFLYFKGVNLVEIYRNIIELKLLGVFLGGFGIFI